MPFPLAGLQIDGHQTLAEEIVAGPCAAVVVVGRQLHGQVARPSSSSTRDLRPDAGVARVGPRVVLPRLVAELARLRNGAEQPQPLAGARRRSRERRPSHCCGSSGLAPVSNAAPTMTTFPATIGVAWSPTGAVVEVDRPDRSRA